LYRSKNNNLHLDKQIETTSDRQRLQSECNKIVRRYEHYDTSGKVKTAS